MKKQTWHHLNGQMVNKFRKFSYLGEIFLELIPDYLKGNGKKFLVFDVVAFYFSSWNVKILYLTVSR